MESRGVTELVHGAARGVDITVAKMVERNLPHVKATAFPYPSEHGKAGGPIRNSEMVAYAKGKPAFCVAFPGGRGTNDMVAKVQRAGIELLDWRDFK
jgi:hypothetical protein